MRRMSARRARSDDTPAPTNETFERLAGLLMLTQPGTATGSMFGHRTLTVAGKAFCVEHQHDVVFKLTGEDHADALELQGARLFDPSGKGRPMREWVQVPTPIDEDDAQGLALAACEYVRTLTAG